MSKDGCLLVAQISQVQVGLEGTVHSHLSRHSGPRLCLHDCLLRRHGFRQSKALEAYQGLDLGKSWGTLHTSNLSFADLVVRHVHEVVVRLVLGDSAIIKDEFAVRSKFAEECTVRQPTFQHGVPAPPPYFEGREDEIQEVSVMLHGHHHAAVIFPIGVGGVGKSQLVVEWVDQNRLQYEIILWIRAEHRDTLCQDLVRLATILDIAVGPDISIDRMAKLVVDKLGNRPASRPNVLLVYDNAESYHDIEPWLPRPGSPCHSIVTTRNSQGCSPSSTIGVGPLDKDSALRVVEYLIERRLACQELPKVTATMEGFGYLPLAIVLFAQMIRVDGVVEDAVAMVNTQTQKMLDSDIELDQAYGGEGRNSVWSVCRTQIKGLSEIALRLLVCLSLLDADNVPKQLLKQFMTNPLDLSEATRELTSRSLVHVSCDDGSFSTHRLIQLNARDFIGAAALTEVFVAIGEALLKTEEGIDYHLGRRKAIVTYILPHLKALIKHWMAYDDSSEKLGELRLVLGMIYIDNARYDLALVEYHESLRIMQAAFGNGNGNFRVAFILREIGRVYSQQGQYERALIEYRESLRIGRVAFGKENFQVASTLSQIGRVYERQGQYERALVEYREALRIYRLACVNDDHPKVAATLSNIGRVCYEQDRERASSLDDYRELLRVELAAYGNEHPSAAFTLHEMGNLYEQQRQYDLALEKFREALRIMRAAYGNEHPRVAEVLVSIGTVYTVDKASSNGP